MGFLHKPQSMDVTLHLSRAQVESALHTSFIHAQNIRHLCISCSYELDPDDGYGAKVLPYDPPHATSHHSGPKVVYRPALQHQLADKFTKYTVQQTAIEPSRITSTTIKPINKFGYKNYVATVSFPKIDSTFYVIATIIIYLSWLTRFNGTHA